MIPRDYIRALVDLFWHPLLSRALAFRGGTALYKLHLKPPARYSEDIDLAQTAAEPAGELMEAVRVVIDSWIGNPQWKQTEGRVTFVYRFDSEDSPPIRLRLKIEINSREHFRIYDMHSVPFAVTSRWFEGSCDIQTYELDELLGTKMRALYQRKKGWDLFDLAAGLKNSSVDADRIVAAFSAYMDKQGHRVTRAQFEQIIAAKLRAPQFIADLSPLLAAGFAWDMQETPKSCRRALSDFCLVIHGRAAREYGSGRTMRSAGPHYLRKIVNGCVPTLLVGSDSKYRHYQRRRSSIARRKAAHLAATLSSATPADSLRIEYIAIVAVQLRLRTMKVIFSSTDLVGDER